MVNNVNYDPNIATNIPGYFGDCLDGNGYTDGTNAYNIANELGQTAGSAIYFAVDASATKSSADMSDVMNYFEGIEQAFSDLSGGIPNIRLVYTVRGRFGHGFRLSTCRIGMACRRAELGPDPPILQITRSLNMTTMTMQRFLE